MIILIKYYFLMQKNNENQNKKINMRSQSNISNTSNVNIYDVPHFF